MNSRPEIIEEMDYHQALTVFKAWDEQEARKRMEREKAWRRAEDTRNGQR